MKKTLLFVVLMSIAGFATAKSEIKAEDVPLLEKHCDKNNKDSCFFSGLAYYEGVVGVDYKKAANYFRISCELGSDDACFNIGLMHKNGKGVPADFAKKQLYFDKACKMGHGDACQNLGIMYTFGEKGLDVDWNKAMDYYDLGCKNGNAISCNNLGAIVESRGKLKESKVLYIKACKLGHKDACKN